MEYARLYEIENDILSVYENISENEKTSDDDKIINSIIYHYTQSYLLKNTIVTSELLQKENGDTFVGLLTYNKLEEHSPKINPDDFLVQNIEYIDSKAKRHEGGFSGYCMDKYNKKYFSLNKNSEPKVYLKDLLTDYPLAKVPLSGLTQFSDWKRTFDDYYGDKIFDIDESSSCKKILPFSMEQIKSSVVGNQIMNKLLVRDKYDFIFEDNLNYQALNLSDRRNYDIRKIDLGEDPAKKLNEIYDINLKPHDSDYSSIYEKLSEDGLKYLKTIINRSSEKNEVLVASNPFGICGILIYGQQLTEDSEGLSMKANWISSIATGREFRGNKIALSLFEEAANIAELEKQILFRTSASPDGSKFLEKQIDESVIKNNYYNIVNSDDLERYLGESIFKLLYGVKDNIEISNKKYSVKRVENPYDEFTSIMKFYRENSPSLDNIVDTNQYYEAKDQREKFINDLIKNIEEALKGDEIKNGRKKTFSPK